MRDTDSSRGLTRLQPTFLAQERGVGVPGRGPTPAGGGRPGGGHPGHSAIYSHKILKPPDSKEWWPRGPLRNVLTISLLGSPCPNAELYDGCMASARSALATRVLPIHAWIARWDRASSPGLCGRQVGAPNYSMPSPTRIQATGSRTRGAGPRREPSPGGGGSRRRMPRVPVDLPPTGPCPPATS
jgi:hypothetical protein